jgi:CHAD domain-containing protein
MAKSGYNAHELVEPAIDGLIARIRASAERMLAPGHDAEAVHDFRVGVRRLRTVLRSARRLYGKKTIQPLLDGFKRLADATNALRDEEVLDETVVQAKVDDDTRREVRAWLERRAFVESSLRAGAEELLRGPDLEQLGVELALAIGAGPRKCERAERFAQGELLRVRAKVRKALPVEEDDVDGLHQLRIRFKRLRYTAEMLGRFLTPADAAQALRADGNRECGSDGGPNYAAVARLAARMQKVLGLLHDADQAIALVSSEEDLDPRPREALLEGLAKLRNRYAREALSRLEDLPPELFGRTVR